MTRIKTITLICSSKESLFLFSFFSTLATGEKMSWQLIDGDLLLKIVLTILNLALFWILCRSVFFFNKKQATNEKGSSDECCKTKSNSSQERGCCNSFSCPCSNSKSTLKIFYASQTGTSKKFASDLANEIKTDFSFQFDSVTVLNISDYELDDFFTEQSICLFIIPTYTGGTPTDDASWFWQWLEDTYFDFRVSRDSFGKMKFAILGLGHSEYLENYNKIARIVQHRFEKLSATSLLPLHMADAKYDQLEQFNEWKQTLYQLFDRVSHQQMTWEEAAVQPAVRYESDDDGVPVEATSESTKNEIENSENAPDLEDLGNVAKYIDQAKRESISSKVERKSGHGSKISISTEQDGEVKSPIKEMVTPLLREALTKQGYKIIGTHSGVKICRWTKAMLRGRGGCYKHTFYGIASHRCMETTPSLACANKCVFCWRHHTNPVGTEWRWKMDDASFVLAGAIENHLKMIKQLKGVPGVDSERFQEAQQVKHCALSLVGEPIMYPQINQFVELLHKRGISSFLVTNAQFPELIETLVPVTQLYVSVDASTKESLKAIDRPLFRDFWERFVDSLKAISLRQQRTVYRLTLVKQFNVDEVANYAQLISIGKPDFIEVKGVTFCGYSGANPLTMSNVPFHSEVQAFCKELCIKLQETLPNNEYAIACEHEHSCSILIAHKKFYINNIWHTWIDYDKFHQLVQDGQPFTSLDYTAPTPEWALTGAPERGFDPKDTRFYRNSSSSKSSTSTGCSQTGTIDHGC